MAREKVDLGLIFDANSTLNIDVIESEVNLPDIQVLYKKLTKCVEEDKCKETEETVIQLKKLLQTSNIDSSLKYNCIDRNIYEAINQSIVANRLETIKPIIENNQPLGLHINYFILIENAIKCKNLLALEYIIKQVSAENIPLSYEGILKNAIQSEKMEILRCIIENSNTKFTDYHIDLAIKKGNFGILQYIVENAKEVDIDNLKTIKNLVDELKSANEDLDEEDDNFDNEIQENNEALKRYMEIFKYLLGCLDYDKACSFLDDAQDIDYKEYIDEIGMYVAAIGSLFDEYDHPIPGNIITSEDIRSMKAVLNYRIGNGIPLSSKEKMDKITNDKDVIKALIEEIAKFKPTDKNEIGKMIEPHLAAILHVNNPEEFKFPIPYSLYLSDTKSKLDSDKSNMTDNKAFIDLYERFPQYKTENCVNYLLNPENSEAVTELLASDLENTDKIFSILTNNHQDTQKNPIMYSLEDNNNLKKLVKAFNGIPQEIKDVIIDQQAIVVSQRDIIAAKQVEINRLQELLQNSSEREVSANKSESFVARIGGKRRHSDSSVIDEPKRACIS